MKKSILILGLGLALVGCKREGGTSDQYGVESGSSRSNYTPITTTRSPDTTMTNATTNANLPTPRSTTDTNATPPANP